MKSRQILQIDQLSTKQLQSHSCGADAVAIFWYDYAVIYMPACFRLATMCTQHKNFRQASEGNHTLILRYDGEIFSAILNGLGYRGYRPSRDFTVLTDRNFNYSSNDFDFSFSSSFSNNSSLYDHTIFNLHKDFTALRTEHFIK